MVRKRFVAALASVVLLATSAQATQLNWLLSGTFDDGGTFSGSFTYDTVSYSFSNIDILTSSNGTLGAHYYAGSPQNGGSYTPANPFIQVIFEYGVLDVPDDYSTEYYLYLSGLYPDTPNSSSLGVGLGGYEGYYNCIPLSQCVSDGRIITSGGAELAPMPEPSTWMVMLAGFGMIGGALRRRARAEGTRATA